MRAKAGGKTLESRFANLCIIIGNSPIPLAAQFINSLFALAPAEYPIPECFTHHFARRGLFATLDHLPYQCHHFGREGDTDFLDIYHGAFSLRPKGRQASVFRKMAGSHPLSGSFFREDNAGHSQQNDNVVP